ncbi:MAG: 1-(5-phosphoribosyl)-5-((5-phosphoribosylamino)methylideneamino)imidazole-4-carboxamide isomerase [Elusimicrobia bacterium HGW-Elusimicrobia-1]|jgi:phosphoribosylformimino-5-aminoimidazole carboxamide ribotide isomerase|nr:MAG: 1-(5-phosphoribosyl)-5-((5-phosphoribosylamino)methylideneamino)imidazole-4-carboxamide isomerase [Elusimicrobia bacterium HGW-Elusimicrobia-1]
MGILIIPAIDVKDGRCVRLTKGRAEDAVFYSDDPSAVAVALEKSGAGRIHLVDLDAAFGEPLRNVRAVEAVRSAVKIPIEIGGGVRTAARAGQLVAAGFDYVLMGTAMSDAPNEVLLAAKENQGRIMAACDTSGGRIAVDGWRKTVDSSVEQYLKIAFDMGIREAIVTDVSRDGTLEGVDAEYYRKLAASSPVDIIVSGGVASLEDIKNITALHSPRISGIIVGKALYEKKFTLAEAMACSR